jgi:hypothetical protein
MPHSTVWKVLWRHGLSRPQKAPKEAVVRYEWPFCGDLLHMDVAKYPRFTRPGHAVTGDRRKTVAQRRFPLGHDHAHVIVDDHSRLAYVELLADERAATVTAFVDRALDWFGEHGISARRLMSDGAFTYTQNRSLRERLARDAIRHLVTEPYRPATNGKVERFHQTMTREWAKGRATKPATSATPRSPPGYTPTTTSAHTAASTATHPSAAFTTYPSTTPSRRAGSRARRRPRRCSAARRRVPPTAARAPSPGRRRPSGPTRPSCAP